MLSDPLPGCKAEPPSTAKARAGSVLSPAAQTRCNSRPPHPTAALPQPGMLPQAAPLPWKLCTLWMCRHPLGAGWAVCGWEHRRSPRSAAGGLSPGWRGGELCAGCKAAHRLYQRGLLVS